MQNTKRILISSVLTVLTALPLAISAETGAGNEGFVLLTAEESAIHQKKMAQLKGPELEAYRNEMYQQLTERARKSGYALPATPPWEQITQAAPAVKSQAGTVPPEQRRAEVDVRKEALGKELQKTGDAAEKTAQVTEVTAEPAAPAAASKPATPAVQELSAEERRAILQAQSEAMRKKMDAHRMQVLAEMEKRRAEADQTAAAADKPAATKDAQASAAAKHQAAVEKMEQHRKQVDEQIKERNAGLEATPHAAPVPADRQSAEEARAAMQAHREAMQKYMEQRRSQASAASKTKIEEDKARIAKEQQAGQEEMKKRMGEARTAGPGPRQQTYQDSMKAYQESMRKQYAPPRTPPSGASVTAEARHDQHKKDMEAMRKARDEQINARRNAAPKPPSVAAAEDRMDKKRAEMDAMKEARDAEIEAHRKEMQARLDAAINGMGSRPPANRPYPSRAYPAYPGYNQYPQYPQYPGYSGYPGYNGYPPR